VTVYFYDDFELNWTGIAINPPNFTANAGNTKSSGSYSGTLQLQAGTATVLTASICDKAGYCTTASASYTYSPPPPPPPPQAAPTLSLAPYNGDNRDPARCVAHCFEQTLSYTTPAYISLDAPRSVTLVYSATTVVPEAIVMLDAIDASPTPPDKMSFKLQRPNQTFVPLEGVGGNPTELFFAQGSNGPSRLGGRFNTGTAVTSDSLYTAVVTSYWGTATTLASTISMRVPMVRETTSPYGAGWTIAGLQRITVQGTDVVLTSGGGAIAFFAGCTTAGAACTSPPGDFTALTRRADNSGWDRRWPDGTTTAFDATGRLTSIADRYSNLATFAYNGTSQQLTSITDPIGQVTTLAYDANGKLDYIRDPAGRVTQVTVNAAGDLTEIYDPDGVRALLVAYDGAHLPLNVMDRVGGQTDFARDVTGKLSQVQLPTVTANGVSARPTLGFRSIDRLVLLDGSGPGTFANPATRRVPDQLRAKITAPNGDSTVFAFDRFGQAARVEFRNPQGQWRVNTVMYNDQGQLTGATTAENGSTSYTWSGSDLVEVRDDNSGGHTAYTYEGTYHQELTASVWTGGADWVLVRQNFYGSLGRLDSTKVGTSKTAYTSDGRGRMLTVTDPLGHQRSTTYDATGLQNTHSVTTPDANGVSRTTTFAYDATGRVQSVTDPTGRVATTTYDPLNRVTGTTGPLATTTQFGYNDATRTYTVTDPKGQLYQAMRNALGWVETQTDPRGAVERYAYDVSGNVVSYTNRRGGVVASTHDALNRPGTRTADGQTTVFDYDPLGYWVAVNNGESVDTVRLDAKGRVSDAIASRNGIRYILQPTYTRQGQRDLLTIVAPSWSRTIGYGYDGLFRLNYLRNQGAQAASVTYTAEQLVNTVQLPITVSGTTKLTETFTYTPAHLPQALAYNGVVDGAVGRRYTYDVLGRVASVTQGQRSDGIGATQNESQRTLGYDVLGRLSHFDDVRNWEEDGGLVCPDPYDLTTCYRAIIPHSDLVRAQDFSYDSVGNRRDLGAVIEVGNRLTAFNGYSLGYDADGNLISKTKAGFTQTLSWNSMGQLTQVVTNGVTTTFGYDGFGRRVRKTVGATTTRYLWDGDDLVMELDAAGNPVREYSHFPGVDQPFAVRRSSDGAIFYYSQERPGHVAGLINTADQVVNRYEYDPWGQPLSMTEAVPQPLKYGGREYDGETGFYYLRARYYDPELGRFISEDPVGLAGGINPFAYLASAPTLGRDPFGLSEDEICPAGYELVGSWGIVLSGGESATANKCVGAGGSVLVVYTDIAIVLTAVSVTAEPSALPRFVQNVARGIAMGLPGPIPLFTSATAEATCPLHLPLSVFAGAGADWFPNGFGHTGAAGVFVNDEGVFGYLRGGGGIGGGLGGGDFSLYGEFGSALEMSGWAIEFNGNLPEGGINVAFDLQGHPLSVAGSLGPSTVGGHVAATNTQTVMLARC
jgi:RHS repeat-associated protein